MTSNQTCNAMIVDVLEELSQEGVTNLCPSIERLFNELMKIEREQVLQVLQMREIPFYPQCLEKGERPERALRLAISIS